MAAEVSRVVGAINNWLQAEATDRSSALGRYVPQLRRPVNGSDSPAFVPIRWRHQHVPQRLLDQTLQFDGHQGAGSRPAGYEMAAVLRAHKSAMDAAKQHFNKVGYEAAEAVAFYVGKRVLVGVLPEDHQFPVVNTSRGHQYEAHMRVGEATLQAAMGIYVPGIGLVVREGSLQNAGQIPVTDLEPPSVLL